MVSYTYAYKPLRQDGHEIRPLQILPRSKHSKYDIVECTMHHVTLDSSPKYVAVSYTWGSNRSTERAIIDGLVVDINRDLENTLQGLRRHQQRFMSDADLFWIDALCINQGDVQEKSSQVAKMRNVYESASSVLVSFNDTKTSSDHIWDYTIPVIQEIYYEIRDLRFAGSSFEGLNTEQTEYINSLVHRLTLVTSAVDLDSMPSVLTRQKHRVERASLGYNLAEEGSQRTEYSRVPVSCLFAFFGHPWWKRVWIVQEVAVSTQVYFAHGTHLISWTSVVSVLYMLYAMCSMILTQHYGDVHYTSWAQLLLLGVRLSSAVRKTWETITLLGNPDPLSTILMENISNSLLESSDPRDKVFAMLGLAQDSADHALTPDYTKSAQDVFIEATKYLIAKHGIRVMDHCSGVDLDVIPGSRVTAPSWIPTWFVKLSVGRDDNGEPSSEFVDLSSSISTTKSCKHLEFGGRIVGSILAVGNVLPVELRIDLTDDDSQMSQTIEIRNWLLEVRALCGNTAPSGGEDTEETGQDDLVGTPSSYIGAQGSGSVCSRGHSPQESIEEALWRLPITGGEDDEALPIDVLRFEYKVLVGHVRPPAGIDTNEWRAKNSAVYRHRIKIVSCDKRAFISSNGALGLGRPSVSPGDKVVFFEGGESPYIVRKGDNVAYKLVGPACISGLKDTDQILEETRVFLVR